MKKQTHRNNKHLAKLAASIQFKTVIAQLVFSSKNITFSEIVQGRSELNCIRQYVTVFKLSV